MGRVGQPKNPSLGERIWRGVDRFVMSGKFDGFKLPDPMDALRVKKSRNSSRGSGPMTKDDFRRGYKKV